MLITLINPPSPYLEDDAAYPPSGLMYLAAAIEQLGYDAKIVDYAGEIYWGDTLPSLDGDVFGITCVTPNFDTVQCMTSVLPYDARIIIGGCHATFLPEIVYDSVLCDTVVTGEAEAVIGKVLADIENGPLQHEYDGGILNAEDIPRRAFHLVDMSKYRSIPIYTSRGCPFNCAFCSKITGRKFRPFPLDHIMSEVDTLMAMGYSDFVFGDDNCGIQRGRLIKIMAGLGKRGATFRLNMGVKQVDDELLALAADNGCNQISYGIESGSSKMLKMMGKNASVEDNRRALMLPKKHGIKTKAYLIVNFPGETVETVKETIAFMKETQPDSWLISNFAPLPGSPVFANPRRYGITWMSPNWEDYYLVGKGGSFGKSFVTKDLSYVWQQYLHDMMWSELEMLR
jgi:radical SAM superfamily enzyme YgiQ (UPF0313 family)